MFVDNTKIYRTISSYEDSILLQNDFNNIMKWFSMWLMDLNYDKYKCMSFGNRTLSMSHYLMLTGEEIFLTRESARSQTWECFLI